MHSHNGVREAHRSATGLEMPVARPDVAVAIVGATSLLGDCMMLESAAASTFVEGGGAEIT